MQLLPISTDQQKGGIIKFVPQFAKRDSDAKVKQNMPLPPSTAATNDAGIDSSYNMNYTCVEARGSCAAGTATMRNVKCFSQTPECVGAV